MYVMYVDLKPSQTSMMELFSQKSCITYIWKGSKYGSVAASFSYVGNKARNAAHFTIAVGEILHSCIHNLN